MSRRKLKKFAENLDNNHIVQPGKPLYENIKGRWNADQFGNNNPIVLELACGRGEYTVGLAREFPDRNFIGVDIKGNRIWTGAKTAEADGLKNAAFLRIRIQNLLQFFEPGEVSEIWITFPDPRPRGRDEKRRLTYPRFLKIYRELLPSEGRVHLKTDNTFLFNYTLETLALCPVSNLEFTHNLYTSEWAQEHHGIKTRYEEMFTAKGEDIKYLRFKFTEGEFPEPKPGDDDDNEGEDEESEADESTSE
ncbi:MAG: tRNA (guanosine(46)-N7)-methyltransferase TrmB [Bacteroidota bacterium]